MARQMMSPTLTAVPKDEDLDLVARGKAIAEKRLALGMDAAPLARAAHVDRATLARIEDGHPRVRRSSVAAVERALADLDEEMSPPGGGSQEDPVVRFVVRGVYGAEALVVEGPVENIAELEASVDRIMRRLRGNVDEA